MKSLSNLHWMLALGHAHGPMTDGVFKIYREEKGKKSKYL